MIWLALKAAKPWHFMAAGLVVWSSFVGGKAYRAGGQAATKKIEAAANVTVVKAEKARAAVRPVIKPDDDCVRDKHCRR